MRGNKGRGNVELLVFGFGFMLCIGGILFFLKSDDTAFEKTSREFGEFKTYMMKRLENQENAISLMTNTSTESFVKLGKSIEQGFKESRDQVSKLRDQTLAMELEIQRLKEKTAKLHMKSIPSVHNINLTIDKPVPVTCVGIGAGGGGGGSGGAPVPVTCVSGTGTTEKPDRGTKKPLLERAGIKKKSPGSR